MANLSRLPIPIIEQWEWQYDGVCRTVDPEVFFPPDSERGPVRQRRELQAKQYCEHCPVLASLPRARPDGAGAVWRLGRSDAARTRPHPACAGRPGPPSPLRSQRRLAS